jgi:hypothetical protein
MIAIHLSHVCHTFFLLKVIDFTWLIKKCQHCHMFIKDIIHIILYIII